MKARKSARVVSIIALVFAPLGFLISFAMYTRDTPLDRTPLLVGAAVVALLEIGGAIATLLRRAIGPRLLLGYGVLAIVHVIADGVYLVAMPARHEAGIASEAISTLSGAIGVLFHLAFSVASFAWPIVVLVLAARWRPKAEMPASEPNDRSIADTATPAVCLRVRTRALA